MIKKILTLNLLILIFVSCKKDKLNGDKAILIGKWNWIHSEHKYGFCQNDNFEEILSPSTEMLNFSVEFFKNGKLQVKKDNKGGIKYRIIFTDHQTIYEEHYFRIILDNDDTKELNVIFSSNTLRILSDDINIPFETDYGCENYRNFFIKQ